MTANFKRCRATGSWTIVVPHDFEEIDNGESWQAHRDGRTVYVSSFLVQDGGISTPAGALRKSAAARLRPSADVSRFDFSGVGVEGEAEVARTDAGFELRGFMCVDGSVAICVINFDDSMHQDWALSTWKTLSPLGAA